MSRAQAIAQASAYFDQGHFMAALQKRVAMRTESQEAASRPILSRYLHQEIAPELERMGFTCGIITSPLPGGATFLPAELRGGGVAFTMLTYGHGNVVSGYDQQWREGFNPC